MGCLRSSRPAGFADAPSPRRTAVRQSGPAMNATPYRSRMTWSSWLLIGLALIITGAAIATWALARYDRAAVVLGVAPAVPKAQRPQALAAPPVTVDPSAA